MSGETHFTSGHLEVDFEGVEYNYTHPLTLTAFHK